MNVSWIHAHVEKYYRFVTVQKNITCEIINSFVLKEAVYEVPNFQNALWVTRMLAVNTSTCQLYT